MPQAERHTAAARPARAAVFIFRCQIRFAVPTDAGDRFRHEIEVIGVHARRAFADEIAAQEHILLAELVGIDAQLACDAVHGALDAPSGLYLPGCARMSRGNFVGVNTTAFDAQMRNTIAAPSGNNRVVRGGSAAGRICAGIDDEIDIQRGDRPVRFDTELGFEYLGVARVLPEAVSCGRHQTHRTTQSA